MKKIKIAMAALLAGVLGFSTSCNDSDNDGTPASGQSRVRIAMTDAPGDYDEVNIEVIGVRYKTTNDQGENGWVDFPSVNAGVWEPMTSP
jgi:hypothetical protein